MLLLKNFCIIEKFLDSRVVNQCFPSVYISGQVLLLLESSRFSRLASLVVVLIARLLNMVKVFSQSIIILLSFASCSISF